MCIFIIVLLILFLSCSHSYLHFFLFFFLVVFFLELRKGGSGREKKKIYSVLKMHSKHDNIKPKAQPKMKSYREDYVHIHMK